MIYYVSHKTIHLAIFIYLCSWMLFEPSVYAQTEVHKNHCVSLLSRYQSWTDAVSSISFKSKEKSIRKDLSGHEIKNTNYESESLIRIDDKRKSFFVSRKYLTNQLEQQSIVTQGGPFTTVYYRNKKEPSKYEEDQNELEFKITSYKEKIKEPFDFSGLLGVNVGYPMLLFGVYSIGSEFLMRDISDSFSSLKLESGTQVWKGDDVCQLTGSNKNGQYELWLNPKLGYMPVHISYKCHKSLKRSHEDFLCFELKVNDYVQIDELYLPTNFSLVIKSNYLWYDNDKLNSAPSQEYVECILSDYAINPDYSSGDFKISYVIPDYTQVSMQDVPQTEYIWMKGKIVPLTDELALARGKNHQFIPGIREPRFWLLAAGLIMTTVAIFIKVKKHYVPK